MKKTLLRISLAGFAAVILLLAGCESPTSFDVSYGNIGSVQNLKVQAYTGVNLLTWDPVADADSYAVYRKEKPAGAADWSEYTQLGSSVSNIRYTDIIGDNNVLKDDTEYTYQVIAKSANSVLSSAATEVSYKTDAAAFPVATPQFPAKGTALGITVSDPAIKVDNVLGRATLTWTASAANPAITYTVTKSVSGSPTWSSATGGASTASVNITGDGFIDAQITAGFQNNYYSATVSAYVEPVAYSVQSLDSISASITSATRTANTNQVVITYSKKIGATEYVLQKAEANDVGATVTWEDVDTTGAVDRGTSYTVTDTITAARWQYRLFVRTANGISAASSSSTVNAVTDSVSGSVSASRRLKTADATPADALDNEIYEIDFTIGGATEGASYQLQYRKLGTSNQTKATVLDEVGEWTAGPSVTATGADLSSKEFHIYFTPPAQRQAYQYRVVGTAAGKSAQTSGVTSITGITAVVDNNTSMISGETIYAFAVKGALSFSGYISGTMFNFTLTGAQPGESVQVYAQTKVTTTTGGNTAFGVVTSLGTITAAATAPVSITIPSPGTDTATHTYEWVNLSYVVNAK